jgi:hypothetical protein
LRELLHKTLVRSKHRHAKAISGLLALNETEFIFDYADARTRRYVSIRLNLCNFGIFGAAPQSTPLQVDVPIWIFKKQETRRKIKSFKNI